MYKILPWRESCFELRWIGGALEFWPSSSALDIHLLNLPRPCRSTPRRRWDFCLLLYVMCMCTPCVCLVTLQVQKGINKVVFPKKLKGNIEALVKGLCNAIPSALAKEPSKAFWIWIFSFFSLSLSLYVYMLPPPLKSQPFSCGSWAERQFSHNKHICVNVADGPFQQKQNPWFWSNSSLNKTGPFQ